jgi:hypothetical protein
MSSADDAGAAYAAEVDAVASAVAAVDVAATDDRAAPPPATTTTSKRTISISRASSTTSTSASRPSSAEEAAAALLELVVRGDPLKSLERAEKMAVAGALACVAVGLDGDESAARAFLRLVSTKILELDDDRVAAVEPLLTPAPRTVADLATRMSDASRSFARAVAPEAESDEERATRWREILAAVVYGVAAEEASEGLRRRRDAAASDISLFVPPAAASAAVRRLAKVANVEWETMLALEDALGAYLKAAMECVPSRTGPHTTASAR